MRRALAALLALTGAARADEPADHWDRGAARPFLAAEVDVGIVAHVALAAGWGKPHHAWGGLLAQGLLTTDVASARLGARVDLQALALEGGLRLDRTFSHGPLPDVDRQTALPAAGGYGRRSLDLAATGGLPLGPGFAIYELLAARALSSPPHAQLFDELLRIVYRPPWLATASAGWVASLRSGALLLGARAQWAYHTGRDASPFVRAGPLAYWRLRPHVALAGELLWPVANPDALALLDPVTGVIVVSFTAATGDPPPRFP